MSDKLKSAGVTVLRCNYAKEPVVEDGAIKKAPKGLVGGKGEEQLYISFDSNNFNEQGHYAVLSATEDLYTKLKNRLDQYLPCLVYLYNYSKDNPGICFIETKNKVEYCEGDEAPYIHLSKNGSFEAILYENGYVSVFYYD